MDYAVLIIVAYLLGSIPFGLIIAKAHGKDLRSIGSGNIGATNVARALGKKWAYFCFLLDVLKGCIPTLAGIKLASTPATTTELMLSLAAGCAAILGHIFPIYVKFKGGKGVATSFGVALGLWPYFTICSLVSFAIWIVVTLIWRYISLASILAAVAFPIIMVIAVIFIPNWKFENLWPLQIAAIAIPILVILRHRENIKRLRSGTESKITEK